MARDAPFPPEMITHAIVDRRQQQRLLDRLLSRDHGQGEGATAGHHLVGGASELSSMLRATSMSRVLVVT